jgi:hypothetical protein
LSSAADIEVHRQAHAIQASAKAGTLHVFGSMLASFERWVQVLDACIEDAKAR